LFRDGGGKVLSEGSIGGGSLVPAWWKRRCSKGGVKASTGELCGGVRGVRGKLVRKTLRRERKREFE